jgi:hypothetical protein
LGFCQSFFLVLFVWVSNFLDQEFILVFGLTKEIDLLENFKGERKLPIDRDSIHEKSLYWYQRVLFDERSSIEIFFAFFLPKTVD